MSNKKVSGIFYIREISFKSAKNGSQYLDCTIENAEMKLKAKRWGHSEFHQPIVKEGLVYKLSVDISEYNGQDQGIISAIDEVNQETVDLSKLQRMPTTPMKVILENLNNVIDGIQHEGLKKFASTLKEGSPLHSKYIQSKAAKSNHHDTIGGLLEHSVSMAMMGKRVASHYHMLNEDLLVVGALFHDIGKIVEISLDGSYTSTGKLKGHIPIGMQIVNQIASSVSLEPEITELLEHLVLSHHGNIEWGSPVTPKIPEAIMLHMLDYYDAQMKVMHDMFIDREPGEWVKGTTMTFNGEVFIHSLIKKTSTYIK